MPKLVLTNLKDMEPERFQQLWREAVESTSPVEDLVEVSRDLRDMELEYGMTSDEFAAKFNRGEMGDDTDFIEWIGLYEMYRAAKKSIEIALMRAAVTYADEEVKAELAVALDANESRRVPA